MADSKPNYNNYSKELLKQFPVLKPGEGIRFRLSGIYFDKLMNKLVVPASTSIKPVDRIFDPGHNEEIDIAYITGSRPLGPNSARSEEILLGEIVFSRGNLGEFTWLGEKATESIAKFLFFSNSNGSNIGKPWYIDGTTQYVIVGDEGAKGKLTEDRVVDRAKAKIETFSDSDLHTLKMAWFPQEHASLTHDQLILNLRKVAERNPDKILSYGGNTEVDMSAKINTFVRAALIKMNDTETAWLFQDGTELCNVRTDETPFKAMKDFLLTETGQTVLKALEVEASKDVKPKVVKK